MIFIFGNCTKIQYKQRVNERDIHSIYFIVEVILNHYGIQIPMKFDMKDAHVLGNKDFVFNSYCSQSCKKRSFWQSMKFWKWKNNCTVNTLIVKIKAVASVNFVTYKKRTIWTFQNIKDAVKVQWEKEHRKLVHSQRYLVASGTSSDDARG